MMIAILALRLIAMFSDWYEATNGLPAETV